MTPEQHWEVFRGDVVKNEGRALFPCPSCPQRGKDQAQRVIDDSTYRKDRAVVHGDIANEIGQTGGCFASEWSGITWNQDTGRTEGSLPILGIDVQTSTVSKLRGGMLVRGFWPGYWRVLLVKYNGRLGEAVLDGWTLTWEFRELIEKNPKAGKRVPKSPDDIYDYLYYSDPKFEYIKPMTTFEKVSPPTRCASGCGQPSGYGPVANLCRYCWDKYKHHPLKLTRS